MLPPCFVCVPLVGLRYSIGMHLVSAVCKDSLPLLCLSHRTISHPFLHSPSFGFCCPSLCVFHPEGVKVCICLFTVVFPVRCYSLLEARGNMGNIEVKHLRLEH